MTAAAAASAIVKEAAASAVVDVLEGASEEERAAKLASFKQEKMRKVIRQAALYVCLNLAVNQSFPSVQAFPGLKASLSISWA